MKWFEGNIPEAIQISKQKGSLFIVYIHGKDELSQQMNRTWESEEVTKCIEENGAVAVKIENTSEECKFFSQIYPVVVVPSVFCIGEGGVPLEVIGGHVQPDDFVNKLKQVEQIHAAQKESYTPPTANTSQQASAAPSTQEQVTPATEEQQESSVASTSQAGRSGDQASTSQAGGSGDQVSTVPLEERVEKAKERMEKKKVEKAQKEFEISREEEIKRRKLGQDLQKLKHDQQETKMKELKEQMRKDKEEEKKAREKIKQQIARDREERQAKFHKDKQEREKAFEEKKREKLLEKQKSAAADEARKSETARIQVRLPDGSSMTQVFPSTDTLQALHSIVSQKLGKNVCLSSTFPKRRFTQEDMSQTFADLELAPTAVLIALPSGGVVRQASSSTHSALQSHGVFSLILSPFIFLWNFLYSLLFGGGNSGAQQEGSSQSTPSSQSYTRVNRPNTAYQRQTGDSSQRDSNMRRLADMRDDDDDMSTYNGNSTQQL